MFINGININRKNPVLCEDYITNNQDERANASNIEEMDQHKKLKDTTFYNKLEGLLKQIDYTSSEENIEIATYLKDKGFGITQKSMQATKHIQKKLNNVFNKIYTDTRLKDEIKHLNINKISVDMLDELFLNDSKHTKQKNNESHKEMPKNYEEVIEMKMKKYKFMFGSEEALKRAVKDLSRGGLPISPNNIKNTMETNRAIDAVKDFKGDLSTSFLEKQQRPTLKNLYTMIHSTKNDSSNNTKIKPSENAITDQALTDHLEKLNLKGDAQTLSIAKDLLSRDLPITKETIEEYNQLRDVSKFVTNHEDQIKESALNKISEGKNPLDFNIFDTIKQDNKSYEEESQIADKRYSETINFLEDIKPVEDDIIQNLLENDETINIHQLQQSYHKDEKTKGVAGQNYKVEQLKIKRQLEELRLKLTFDATLKLQMKNIDIQTEPLEKVVKHLKELEFEASKNSFELLGHKANSEDINNLLEVREVTETLKVANASILGQFINTDDPITIKELSISNAQEKADPYKLYEPLLTKAEHRFSEGFSKIKDQVNHVLEMNQIPINKLNQRAASILIQNNLEIDANRICEIKNVDIKMNEILQKLHPTMVAKMLKDGKNPLNLDIDDVNEYIQQFEEEFEENTLEKVSKYIYDMKKSNSMTDTEKDYMVNVYRALNLIERSEGRALGVLYKNKRELTLGNIMEAAKHYKKTHGLDNQFNIGVDDTFGEKEEVLGQQNSIKDIIDESLFKDYAQTLMRQTAEMLTPEKAAEINKNEYDKLPLEDLYELLDFDKNKQSQLNTQKLFEQIKNQINNEIIYDQSSIELLNHTELPATLDNVLLVHQYTKEPFLFTNKIKSLKKAIEEDKAVKMKFDVEHKNEDETMPRIESSIQHKLSEVEQDFIEYQQDVDTIYKIMMLQKEDAKSNSNYQIPVQINGEISNLNIKVLNEEKLQGANEDDLSILFNLRTNTLGDIFSSVIISNKDISIRVPEQKYDSIKFFKQYETTIADKLKDIGFNLKAIETVGVEA